MLGKFIKGVAKEIFYTVTGAVVFVIVLAFAILSLPVYVYRWLLTKLIAPCFSSKVGKALTVLSQFMATEFIPENASSNPQYPPSRCTVVIGLHFPGIVSHEEMSEVITTGLLDKKADNSTNLKYPELRQYIEQWMGYMFWKPDPIFNLENHLHLHKIPDNATRTESETILQDLFESLLNGRFAYRRSPWEIHLLQNYKNPDICSTDENGNVMTIVLFRIHHAMADGQSIFNAFIEDLFGKSVENLKTTAIMVKRNKKKLHCVKSAAITWLYKPWRCIRDLGISTEIVISSWSKSSTPWNCPGHCQSGKQIYGKSLPIPVHKVKTIKNRFGVTFTAVLLSCVGAGIADSFKGFKTVKNNLPIFCTLPLPGHPKKLRNHATATILKLNTCLEDPVERLKNSQPLLSDARYKSQVPIVGWTLAQLVSAQPAVVAKHLLHCVGLPAFFTNFSAHELDVEFKGRKILAWDYTAGRLNGRAGVFISVISLGTDLRISLSAENGVMDRAQLAGMFEAVHNEVEVLYQKATLKESEPNEPIDV